MTRTEGDLRAVLEASEQQAPDASAVLDAVKRRIVKRGQRRRSTTAYVGAALAVAAVVMVPSMLRSSGLVGATAASSPTPAPTLESAPSPAPTLSPTPIVTAAARPALTFTIQRSQAGSNMRIEPFVITPNRQWALVRQSGVIKGMSAELYVYERGRFNVDRYLTGEPLTVNGKPGFYKVAVDPDTFGTAHPTERATIVWQYTSGAWAVVMSTQDAVQRDQLLQIATSMVLGEPVPAIVPFKLGYVPQGLHAIRLSQSLLDASNPSASVMLDVANADVSTVDNDPGLQRPLQVTAMPAISKLWNPTGTIAGYPMTQISGNQIAVDVGGWWIELRLGTDSRLPFADIERIVAEMTVATLSDPGTWFAATTAIP